MPQLWTTEQLSNHVFPHAFLIDPIIPRGGIVLFHGKRGLGKTNLMHTIAACLSEKGWLFGKYPTHLQGPMVYVQADMTAMITQRRFRYIMRYHALKDLYFFFPNSFDLATVGPDEGVIQEIKALKPNVIFWDTLRKIQRLGTNEDDVPSFIYGKAQQFFPYATHFFVHHDKKSQIDDNNQLEEEESFRGSGAWLDDCDTGLHLSKLPGGALSLSFTKHRTCEDQPTLTLKLNRDNLLLYANGSEAAQARDMWLREHQNATPADLKRFLLGSFVAAPESIERMLGGTNG